MQSVLSAVQAHYWRVGGQQFSKPCTAVLFSFRASSSDPGSGGPDEPRSARGELLARQLFNELHGTSALGAADDLGAWLAGRVVGWKGLGE